MTWWDKLSLEIELEFARAQNFMGRHNHGRAQLPAKYWLQKRASQREYYARIKLEGGERYEARLRQSREKYRSEVGQRWYNAYHEANQQRRQERIAGKICKAEGCGKPVAERKSKSGPTPVFCSPECSRRTAGLAYYHRKRIATMKQSGAVGRWFITPHAVKRYRERIAPNRSYEEALGVLIRASEKARLVKVSVRGFEYYKGPAPERLRFRVRPAEKSEGDLPVLMTVLPAFDPPGSP